MGKRRKARIKMVLPVRIWGTDTTGKPFSLLSHTLDITSSGARLGGFRHQVQTGDSLWVQCRHRKAQFKVVWVGRPGSAREHQIGVECLEERSIWGLELHGEMQVDDYEPPQAYIEEGTLEHRRYTRYPCSGGAEVCLPHASTGVWGQVSDISRNGCYVQMQSPLRVATAVKLLLKIGDVEISMRGMVRTHHPDVGMGVQFTMPSSQMDADRLENLVRKLEAGEVEAAAAAVPKPDTIAVAERLKAATKELSDIDELLKCIEVDPLVLSEFRESLGHVRNTAWALQRWVELQQGHKDPLSILAYLNHERIRLATKLCHNLHEEMRSTELDLPRKDLRELLRAVEDLFTALAGFDFTILEVEPAAAAGQPLQEEVSPPQEEAAQPRERHRKSKASHSAD